MSASKISRFAAAAALSAALCAVSASAAEIDSDYLDALAPAMMYMRSSYAATILSPRAIRAKAVSLPAPEITGYTSDEHSITLTWTKIENAEGYTVYAIDDGIAYPVARTVGETFAVIENLASGKEYTFKVQAFGYSDMGPAPGSKSKAYSAVTVPSRLGTSVVSIVSDPDEDTLTVSWSDMNADFYVLYVLDQNTNKWLKAAKTAANSVVIDLDTPAEGAVRALSEIKNREYGYRFAVKAYVSDSEYTHTYSTKLNRMDDIYYDLNDLKDMFGGQYELLENVLRNNYTGVSKRSYTVYTSSADENGNIVTTSGTGSISDESVAAIEKFAAEHFEEGWTDAEKIMYTLNWINKNVKYDTEFEAPDYGYADNIFTYKLGQCNSYNGAVVEMLTYMGYDGCFLQCMTNSVRFSQHFRGGIYSDGRYYTFESGNDGRYAGWLWLIKEGMEVPLEGTVNVNNDEDPEDGRIIVNGFELPVDLAEIVNGHALDLSSLLSDGSDAPEKPDVPEDVDDSDILSELFGISVRNNDGSEDEENESGAEEGESSDNDVNDAEDSEDTDVSADDDISDADESDGGNEEDEETSSEDAAADVSSDDDGETESAVPDDDAVDDEKSAPDAAADDEDDENSPADAEPAASAESESEADEAVNVSAAEESAENDTDGTAEE